MLPGQFIHIATISNLIEAQIIEEILSQENIPFLIRSYHDTAYDGLFQFQKGWGVLQAYPEDQSKILNILNDIRKETPFTEDIENMESDDQKTEDRSQSDDEIIISSCNNK